MFHCNMMQCTAKRDVMQFDLLQTYSMYHTTYENPMQSITFQSITLNQETPKLQIISNTD